MSVLQDSQSETAEFLVHFRFDFAVSDFPLVAPGAIFQVFAEDGPGGSVVANIVVRAYELVRRRRLVDTLPLLRR